MNWLRCRAAALPSPRRAPLSARPPQHPRIRPSAASSPLGSLSTTARRTAQKFPLISITPSSRKWNFGTAHPRSSRLFSDSTLIQPSEEASEADVIKFYEDSAKAGDPSAQFKLGLVYAKEFFEDNEVALLDADEAQRQIAQLAESQRQVGAFDFKKWLRAERKRLLQAAAERAAQQTQRREASGGDCEGRVRGVGGELSSAGLEAAVWWFQCAAKQGHAAAHHWLGVLFERAYAAPEPARSHWEAAAAADYGPALLTLGSQLLAGGFLSRDTPRGLQLLHRGAAFYAPCAFWYGYLLHAGAADHGLQRDDALAMRYIQAAADMGDAPAQHYLAMALASGDGVTRDVRLARQWLERAAESQHPEALYVLACELAGASDSSDVDRAAAGYELDLPRARQLFAEAARGGHVEAMCALGAMFYRGLGGPRDLQRAFYAYQNAALRDHAGAARNLADLFQRGEGVSQSPENAAFWYSRAEQLEQQHKQQQQ